jgi:hypothetical protein
MGCGGDIATATGPFGALPCGYCTDTRKSPKHAKKIPRTLSVGFFFLLFAYCIFVVGRAGFEPATNGLKVRCSTS